MKLLVFLFALLMGFLPQESLDSVSANMQNTSVSKEFLLGKTHYEQDSTFVLISSEHTVLRKPNNYIKKETYEAFKKMYEAARQDGINLVITSASRNFWVQRYIWEQKWKASKIADKKQRALEILKYNSMCGTSRHHWGTELDFNSPKLEFWNSERGKKTYKWLCENAHKYGFYQPYTAKSPNGRNRGYNEEKWHWSYAPLSAEYTRQYKLLIKPSDLKGFLGDDLVEELDIIGNYVFGIAQPNRSLLL
jgi:LAS superfamily LD-carboxypeptidase LdcB